MGALACLAACSDGGGSSGDGTAPVIIGAALDGSGPGPVAGDTLVMFLSENVGLAMGAGLDDLDLELSLGTLGTVAGPPTLLAPRAVEIVLGPGVSFTSGIDTITFRMGNDAIRDLSGLFGTGGTPVVVTLGDGDSPTITAVTINGIDALLNGTGPAGGTLQTPRNSFTINITATDPTSPIDPPEVTTNFLVTVGGVPRFAGTDISGDLTLSQLGSTYSYLVPSNVLFTAITNTLTILVRDTTGMISTPVNFTLSVRSITDFSSARL